MKNVLNYSLFNNIDGNNDINKHNNDFNNDNNDNSASDNDEKQRSCYIKDVTCPLIVRV